ncbi:MAG TPA: glycosyltransferase, partial [Gemmatimonadaceae bacterium]|nr:glycosyltransferase [Gemmatimonadaceae bacterium]
MVTDATRGRRDSTGAAGHAEVRSASPPLRAIVVVLGDLGASPRMLYHAMALADEGYDVTLLGYAGHTLPREVLGREKVRVRYLQSPPARRNGAAGLIVQALWRSLVQPLELLRRIVAATPAELVLVQVPPAIPNLLVTALAGRACGCRVVVDWHNFGWSMLALRAGVAGAAVAAARVYERSVATLAHAHLCVSSAMRDVLVGEWKLSPVAVLYDKPAAVFLAAAPSDLHPLRKFLHHVAGPGSDRAALTAITST